MGSDIKNITTKEWEETVEVVEQFKDILNDEKKVNLANKTNIPTAIQIGPNIVLKAINDFSAPTAKLVIQGRVS